MASILVVAASPSGPIGLVQESTAAGKMILTAASTAQTPLLKDLASDLTQKMSIPKPPAGATPAQVQGAAAEILKRTSDLLAQKASPEEATELKQCLAGVAKATAEATKEGGFLGFGGTLVSEEEKAALATVNSTLGLAAYQPRFSRQLIDVEADSLCEGQVGAVVDGVGGTAHVLLPCVGAGLAPSAGLFFASEGSADLCA